jgi:hypothetical protein
MPLKRRRFSANFLVTLPMLAVYLVAAPAHAQTRRCTCDFADSKWEAYGTKAICATFMHKGRTSCEVEFGGFGADPNLLSRLLGFDPETYRTMRAEALTRYFRDVQSNDKRDLSDPKFLQTILPILMRGAYMRPMTDVPTEKIKDLDFAIATFFDKNSSDVSDTFLALKPHFSKEWRGAKFEVSRGFLSVDHEVGRITVIYFSSE